MRYDIDMSEGGKRWSRSGEHMAGRLLAVVTSTAMIALFIGVLMVGIGYFAVFVPLFGVSPVHKDQLKNLRLLQKSIEQQREGLLREGKSALQLQMEAPAWAPRIQAIGEHAPDGLWLSRVALEEDRSKGSRRPASGPQAQAEPVKLYLVVEGRVDARRSPSPLDPISRFVAGLQGDTRIQEVVPSLQLVSTSATKDDPSIVGFQIRGLWNPEAWKGKVEDRIQSQLKDQGSTKRKGS